MERSDDRFVVLAEAFTRLNEDMGSSYDPGRLLDSLARACLDLFAVDAVGCSLAEASGRLGVARAIPGSPALSAMLILDGVTGPGSRAHESGERIAVPDLTPTLSGDFDAAASAGGFRAVYALPMRHRADRLGAVTLLGAAAGPLTRSDLDIAQALVNGAAAVIAVGRSVALSAERMKQLQSALTSRIVIEQAKGLVAAHHSGDLDAAFMIIRATSRNTNTRLHDVAAAVVDGRMSARTMVLRAPRRR